MAELKEIKEHARELEAAHGERNKIFRDMEKMYWMEWDEESLVKNQIRNVKLTKSPRARTAIQGAERLLLASDPLISVPHDINNETANRNADKLEKFCKAMWFAAGRVNGDPVHYDVVRSALLYSEVHIAITSTADLVEHTKGSAPAVAERARRIHARTPFLFEVWNPSEGYPERGPLGLDAFFRKCTTTAGKVKDAWGEAAAKALKSDLPSFSRFKNVTLCDFWDLENHYVWLDENPEPILAEPHGLPFVPIVAQTVEGSSLFHEPEKQREPFLYTLKQSKLWERQNLILTVMYSLMFAIGANPMYVLNTLDPNGDPEIDWTQPGGYIKLRPGEHFESLAKQVIDPSLLQGWTIANDLEMQSTIYRQTLGEPLGANAPYSMVALLSQSGRLPLTVAQRKASWAIGEAMELALRMLKADKRNGSATYRDASVSISPADIPDEFEIAAQLEIALPQDRLQAANAANALTMSEKPMVSQRWVRENILNIGQSSDMTKEIWDEEAAQLHYRKWLLQQMAQMGQLEQMAMQPGAASGMPGSAPVGPVMPPGMGSPAMMETPGQAPPLEPVEPLPSLAPAQQPLR